MEVVFVMAKAGDANARMDGEAKIVLLHKRPTVLTILTMIMVSITIIAYKS